MICNGQESSTASIEVGTAPGTADSVDTLSFFQIHGDTITIGVQIGHPSYSKFGLRPIINAR